MRAPANPPAPTAAMPSFLAGLLAMVETGGVSVQPWLEAIGLHRRDLDSADRRLPLDSIATLIEQAIRHIPAGTGLDLGRRQHIGNFGLVGLAMSTAATFGDALQIGLRFTPVIGGLMRFVEAPSPRPGVLALDAEMLVENPAIEQFVAEEFVSSCLALADGLLGEPLRPLAIDFAYPEPGYGARYREIFDCPLAFDRPCNRLLVDARALATPLRTHNPTASWQVLALCEAQMPRSEPQGEVAGAVARLLGAALAEDPKLAGIAARLHVSERTLRRQLSMEGTSFHAIHDRLRIERALALLQEPKTSVASVGAQVGFRDPREFRRAFKRWTGATPSAARARR